MSGKGFPTITEQVAQLLKDGIAQGRWRGTIPGRNKLAAELGVNHKTVNAALQLLEKDGLLVSRGAGREREIILHEDSFASSPLHIKILLYDKSDAHSEYIVQLSFQLKERGHHITFADKSLLNLRFDVKRVAQMVEKDDADAWVILAGSRPVLEWFTTRNKPAFAMFGRHANLHLANLSTDKFSATTKALQKLVDLGHRRIVMLTGEEYRKPVLGSFEKWFLVQLESMGVTVGAYNLPDWENDRRSLHQCLDSLFRHTPPTALFINDPVYFFVTLQHLSSKGLAAPRDISLVVMEDHPAFEWFDPEVTVISTSTRRWVPRVVQWVDNVAKGKDDRHKTIIHSKFIEGGMIGPAPKS
jgi:DNA-binding LacI/PurR family transcriptional regulator